MELSAFVPKDTLDLTILDPRDGKPTDVVFTLAGPAHPARQAATRALLDGLAAAGAGQENGEVPADQQRALNTDYMAACLLGWKGLARDGQPLAHSLDEARALLGDPRFVLIRSQVDRALGDNRRFFE